MGTDTETKPNLLSKSAVKASLGTVIRRSKGKKFPTREVREIVRLANLVPYEQPLPTAMPADVSELPDAIRLELADHMRHPKAWHIPLEKIVKEIRHRNKLRQIPDRNKPDYSEKYLRRFHPIMEQGAHYRRIIQARENLDRLVAVNEQVLPHVNLVGEVGLFRKPDGSISLEYDDFTESLRDKRVRIAYLRRCKHRKCGRFFYATRLPQPGCIPAHSTLVRKERKRKRDKDNRNK